MLPLSQEKFEEMVSEAIDAIPEKYLKRLENVAFIVEDEPSQQQRANLKLKPWESLLGLYEGAPLPARGGGLKLLPDKITIFKNPLLGASSSEEELRDRIHHTVWHEVAHYFGLDHKRIDELDSPRRPKNNH